METINCKERKCHKEINPEVYPGVYFGKPWVFDENYGGCVDCQGDFLKSQKTIPKIKLIRRIKE